MTELGKVLVCDDHDLMRSTIAELLEQYGYDAVEARNADEALAQIGGSRPDVVIMDLRLGGTSGIDAIRRIRADPAAAGTRVILMSGEIEPGSDSWTQAGADAYLPKPFEVRELLDVVAGLIER